MSLFDLIWIFYFTAALDGTLKNKMSYFMHLSQCDNFCPINDKIIKDKNNKKIN